MKKISLFLILIFILSASLCACTPTEDDGKITVGVTVAPVAAFVREVCGDRANVIVAVPSGASPESYDPTPREILELASSDVYFAIGLPSEKNVLPALGEDTLTVNLHERVSEKIPDLMQGEERDPHIWLSVSRARLMSEIICDTMCALDAEGAEAYTQGAETFKSTLDSTSARIEELFANLNCKKFIVFHPAFGYFADEYGLEMHALEREGKEVTAKDLQELTDLARENGIKVIFYQAQTSERQARAFAEGIDGEAVMLDPLSENYIENLITMAEKIAGVG